MQGSILGRAVERGLLSVDLHNFRDYARDRHHTVDDYAYGGGPGMVLKPEPLFQAVESLWACLLDVPWSCSRPRAGSSGRPMRSASLGRSVSP